MIWPVILSGGSGTRLWPLSRLERPKQLLPLAGERTMVQATAERTADTRRFRRPVVVANEAHRSAILDQLGAIGIRPEALILEPVGRNTAPAIALAAEHIAASDPEGLMLVMPSDHVIADTAAFLAAVEALRPFVRDGWLATFGIRATAPETGYGYIRFGERLGDGVCAVRQFVEKPDRPTAEDYLASGDYAWNGGIFLMRADRYLAALAANAPAIRAAVTGAMCASRSDGAVLRPDADLFAGCPSDSIDYAVMEKDDRVAVAPVDMGWSDIGSWDALWEVSPKDEAGNAAQGDVRAIDARDCLIRSEGPLVALVGVDGLTVVADRDAVLIAGRGRGQDVKKIVDRLAAEKRTEHVRPAEVAHGWGTARRRLVVRAIHPPRRQRQHRARRRCGGDGARRSGRRDGGQPASKRRRRTGRVDRAVVRRHGRGWIISRTR
jgi:mannose-1-phosphate guanylyltransferase